ncbi:uncharacterized protein CANTADRAFT_54160 [Suhomyces tanzawaensis NRRL Y-17324]|uniref:HECT-type E3 ubiquitin transferase n=1 Tax=Suhomyces tanzawaensis NRRL Y-17324 TaxID=984487 RepID=A0A1E4SE18_9ASCO|nr:uncharacterized protein CANTADRAFT_54160 [Suhomyces tanzawaensis NRRL Y-17324]ODV77755.1 hypothetical protein CANTADRAFT_54160 [Suhomyces tanzawaensis NRRL Y-17324]
MINFTGLSKKRIVNLGDRRTGPAGANFLEQSRLQRLQREEQRQKEKAAILLQSRIRRYLALTSEAKAFRADWRSLAPDSHWSLRFQFVAKWCFSSQPLPDTQTDLTILWDKLDDSGISTSDATIVLHTLVFFIYQSDRIIANDHDRASVIHLVVQCINKCLDIVQLSPGGLQVVDLDSFSLHLIEGLIAFLRRMDGHEPIDSEVALVFRINSLVPLAGFIHLLSIPGIFKSIEINTSAINLPVAELSQLSQSSLIDLITNFLDLHGGSAFTFHDYQIIGAIFDHVNFSIHLVESSEDYIDDDDHDACSIAAPESSIQTIQLLYTASFVNELMNYFLTHKDTQKSDTAVKIVSGLFMLHPKSQSKLSMWITITPGAFKWFHDELKKYDIYHRIQKVHENGNDYLKLEELRRLLDSDVAMEGLDLTGATSRLSFWKAIYAFEELYSFWLIVSNDLESFHDDKLNLKEAFEFLKFLRGLCLTLIFIPQENEGEISSITAKLKNISISLLNQLYLKNLRLKFLPENFWEPKQITFNIDSLIQITIEEEQKSDDEDADIDDRDLHGPEFSSPFADLISKLQILKSIPFFIPFKDRVKIFQSLIELDKQNRRPMDHFSFIQTDKLSGDIRREFLLEDAFKSFYEVGSNFKNRIQVVFYNEYGGKEAGIDGGGITKEFLTSVVQEGFNPSHELKLFNETSEHEIYPNNEIGLNLTKKIDTEYQHSRLKYLKFLGMVIGKCFYENVLVDVSFAPFFINKWCNENLKNSINDLRSLDNELFQNLMKLERMNAEELKELDLNFAVNENLNGKSHVFEISKNGESLPVTEKNKLNYIHQISNFKLNVSLYIQTKFFIEGLEEIISPNWLKMFDSFELQMLISGGESDVNIDDWKDNVEYGGFFDDDLTIRYFWEVVREMNSEERFKLIKFVTSVSRAPLLGFGSLSPKFGIRNSGRDIERLPTASTCVNLLKLPDYQNKKLIREKLLYAINEDARFDLS